MNLKRILLLLCFVILLYSTSSVNAGGFYYISLWNEEIVINEDASLTMREEITFRFISGDFGYAYRTVPHKGFNDMISISVVDDEGTSLAYSLTKGSDYEVRWEWARIYVGSTPIEKTFALTYVLTNAMNYENADLDRDRLYWNIVTDCEVDIHDMNVDVTLPAIYNLNGISAGSYCSGSSTDPPQLTNSTTNTVVSYHQSMVDTRED